MKIDTIKEYLGKDWHDVTNAIVSALKSDIELLNDTNNSILSNSGKQLRPLMSILFARLCAGAGANEAAVRYAAAAELLHNATLLHDDVADDSDQRRGVPTIRSLMGPSVSVLVGDYWLVKAMELILQDKASDTRVIKIFSKTLSDLAQGEMLQLQKAQSGDTNIEDYLRIIYSKTASLFEASCVSAVEAVEADDIYIKSAGDYAVALGIAFQIKDDILDYDGTDSVGKPLGVDILEQKITMPLLGAMKNAGEQEEARIRQMVKGITDHPEYHDEIVSFVRSNGGLDYAEEKLESYVNSAVEALSVFPDSYEKSCLETLAYYTSKRIK